jgi:hypothetical protein
MRPNIEDCVPTLWYVFRVCQQELAVDTSQHTFPQCVRTLPALWFRTFWKQIKVSWTHVRTAGEVGTLFLCTLSRNINLSIETVQIKEPG